MQTLQLFLSVALVVVIDVARGQDLLKDVRKYEDMRSSANDTQRLQNVDVLSDDIATCHLVMMMPFSAFGTNGERISLNVGSYQGMAAVLLATQHLNTGNGTIVQQVQGLNERCPVKFTTEMFDSSWSEKESLNHVVDIISREPGTELLPCAFLGLFLSSSGGLLLLRLRLPPLLPSVLLLPVLLFFFLGLVDDFDLPPLVRLLLLLLLLFAADNDFDLLVDGGRYWSLFMLFRGSKSSSSLLVP